MDKKKNFDLFLSNKRPEKIPVSFWHHFVSFHDHYLGLESSTVKEAVYKGQLETIRVYDPDFVKLMSDGYFGHPSVWDTKLNSAEDLLKIKSVGPNHPWIDAQVEFAKEMVEKNTSGAYVFYNVFSPLQYIRLKLEEYDEDMDKFVSLFFENKEYMLKAAEEIEKDVVTLVERLFKEAKIDGIYYSVQSIQDSRANRAFHEKFVAPSDLSILDVANNYSDKNLLHICGYGHYKNDLSFYVDYPVAAYNWAVFTENVSLSEGKKLFKGKPVFGGFDNNAGSLLYEGDEEALTNYLYKSLDESGVNGIAIGADCTVDPNLSVNQIKLIDRICQDYLSNH